MISVKRDDKGSGRLGEGGRAAQGRKRKGGSQHKLWKVGISQSEWVLGSGQAGKVEPGGKKIRSVVCVATVPSTMASPGPNKYLRKEGSKEGKKQGREEERAERKVANPSLLSPGFRSGCGGMYVDSEKVCSITEKTFQQVKLDQTFLGGNSVL